MIDFSSLMPYANWYRKYQKHIIFGALIAFTLLTLGIPFTSWWFYGADDAHALLLGAKTSNWSDLVYFFYNGHANQGQIGPSNFIASHTRTGFFTTYYRPLSLIWYTLFYWTFEMNGYAFHLINTCIHGLNGGLLFLIFCWFCSKRWAALAACMFLVHPQIAFRFGAFVNLQYYLSLTGILCIALLWRRFLDQQHKTSRFLACAIYSALLFLRESTIVIPMLLSTSTLLYKQSVRTTIPFFAITFSFLGLRLWLYPMSLTPSTFNLGDFLIKKSAELHLFIFDVLHLSWLPWGIPLIRWTILIICFAICLWLFMHHRQKLTVVVPCLMAAGMLWPVLLGPYSPRYFYEAHPFIIVAFIMLLSSQLISKQQATRLWYLLAGIVVIQWTFCIINFQRRSEKMKIIKQALISLTTDPMVANNTRPLCFLGHPFDGFANQHAPYLWLMLHDNSRSIYIDSSTALIAPHDNGFSSTVGYTIACKYPSENAYTVAIKNNSVTLTSNNPDRIHFCLMDHGYSLGTKETISTATTRDGRSVVTAFVLTLDDAFIRGKPLFFRWDFKEKKFIRCDDTNDTGTTWLQSP